MEALRELSAKRLSRLEVSHKRYLFDRINWSQRLISIRGARGTGKSTLVLQYLKDRFPGSDKGLYASMDHIWFYDHSLLDLADDFSKSGGKMLVLDEVHNYAGWSVELKNIYDHYPELQVIFTGSSALHLLQGNGDLSRRLSSFMLEGLSFREFLLLNSIAEVPALSLDQVLANPPAEEILPGIRPLEWFSRYLRYGYYPFFLESDETEYLLRLQRVIDTVITKDITQIADLSVAHMRKVRQLLAIISESVPFKPNISALARKMEIGRDTVYQLFNWLADAKLIQLMHPKTKGIVGLQKPQKVFLENTNLMHGLSPSSDTGNIRETFFVNQLRNSGHEVHLAEKGDFLVDGKLVFEVGGKHKKQQQIKDVPGSYIAADGIETGWGNKIPLWLFGMMY